MFSFLLLCRLSVVLMIILRMVCRKIGEDDCVKDVRLHHYTQLDMAPW